MTPVWLATSQAIEQARYAGRTAAGATYIAKQLYLSVKINLPGIVAAESATRTGTVPNCPANGARQGAGAHEQETAEISFHNSSLSHPFY